MFNSALISVEDKTLIKKYLTTVGTFFYTWKTAKLDKTQNHKTRLEHSDNNEER